MKYLRYLALLGVLALPLTYSQAQVRVGVGIGFGGGYGPGYVSGPPACPYGYYPDYPYGCAPYGYYGPSYFVSGVFIGAGPWFHGYGNGYGNSYYGRPVYNSGYYDRGYYDRDDRRFDNRTTYGRPPVFRRDFVGGGSDRGGFENHGNRHFEDRGSDRRGPATSNRGGNEHRSEGEHRGDRRR